MGRTEGQSDGERGAHTLLAVRGDGATMQADQFFDQRQADSAALGGPCPCVFDAMETFEEPGHLRDRYSDPGVGDRDDGIGALATDPDRDDAFEGVLQRIGKQVEHHLLPHLTVQVHRLIEWRAVHGQRQTRPVDRRSEDARQFGGDRRQVGLLEVGLHAPGLDAREIQQRVDQLG